MNALLWKDYRDSFPMVVVGTILLVAPFVFWIAIAVYSLNAEGGTTWGQLLPMLNGCAFGSLVLSQLTMLLLGGQIIASERQTRSAEFLFCLPPSRSKIAASKLLLAVVFSIVIWSICLLAIFVTNAALEGGPTISQSFKALSWIAVVGLALFGAAWFGSSFMSSPTIAVGMSIAVIVGVFVSATVIMGWLGFENAQTENTVFTLMLLTGLVGIIGGFIHFVRRIEP